MAEAVIEERQLLKTLRWYDGFVIALANPGFLLGSLGYSVGDLGGWGALLLWGIAAAIAVFLNTIYSEMATMFPDKNGMPLYANEAWRKYSTLVGPIATFGYWIGWSVVLSVNGVFMGQIVQGAWFPDEPLGGTFDEGYFSTGGANIGLPQLIAIGLIVAVWLFNVYGARVGVTFGYAAGVLLMVPLFVMMFMPFINGSWTSENMTFALNDGLPWGGWQLALVWLWLMSWSAWGVDTCATFAPEYKDTVRDTKLALRSAALFSLIVYTVLPLGFVGGGGAEAVASYDYVGAMNTILGTDSAALTDFLVVCILASFIITMNTATADGGRALYGVARSGLSIKQLERLNRHHVPGFAMTVDMIVNILFVLFIGNIFGILAASNLGYVICHVFALSGFILLRRDRPNWPRPIKLPGVWIPIAGILCAYCILISVVGFGWFQNAAGGYGGTKEKVIAVAVLAVSVVLFFFRRIVQDKEHPHWREETPTEPAPGYFEEHGIEVPARAK
ncbi:MAG: APC family permease [Gaiellales bacterium]